MISLFNIKSHIIHTDIFDNLLHGSVVTELEETIADYVGAKYAVTFNSATSAIFLALLNKNVIVKVPSMIPPVVLNAIITSGNRYEFTDNVDWVGDSYILHEFDDYKIVDSAQKLEANQFTKECNDNDLMVFSFYPTKPIGSCDGGMIVSNDFNKIKHLKELALNGMTHSKDNWDRTINFVGYKMYMNSIQAHMALKNFELYPEKLIELENVRNIYNAKLNYNNTSNHLYRIDVDERDVFMKYMKKNGVSAGIHYSAAHLNPVYSTSNTDCPISTLKAERTVSIPFHEALSSLDINHILNLIHDYKNGYR